MRLCRLVWGQHRELEKPASINRSRDLLGGWGVGSSVILSRLKPCFLDKAEKARTWGLDLSDRCFIISDKLSKIEMFLGFILILHVHLYFRKMTQITGILLLWWKDTGQVEEETELRQCMVEYNLYMANNYLPQTFIQKKIELASDKKRIKNCNCKRRKHSFKLDQTAVQIYILGKSQKLQTSDKH